MSEENKITLDAGPFEVALRVIRAVMADAWDEAVASLLYEDGTPLEVVKNINPYREANE